MFYYKPTTLVALCIASLRSNCNIFWLVGWLVIVVFLILIFRAIEICLLLLQG